MTRTDRNVITKSFCLSRDCVAAIDALAKRFGVSNSEVIRRAIEAYSRNDAAVNADKLRRIKALVKREL